MAQAAAQPAPEPFIDPQVAGECLGTIVITLQSVPVNDLSPDPEAAALLRVAVEKLSYKTREHVPRLVRHVLAKEPNTPYAYVAWGCALIQAGRHQDAAALFDTALELFPNFPVAIGGKALAVGLLGPVDGAEIEAQRLRDQLHAHLGQQHAEHFARMLPFAAPDRKATDQITGWRGLNLHFLESLPGANGYPFSFNPECRFPLDDDSITLAYGFSLLPRFDEQTVGRVLDETHRVVNDVGAVIFKHPDYEAVLDHYRRGDPAITDLNWQWAQMTPTWQAAGVDDSLVTRTAGLFGLYSEENYIGPPQIGQDAMREVLASDSPAQIARALRESILETRPDAFLERHSAWTAAEFTNLLSNHGFNVVSSDPERIRRRFKWVPGIDANASGCHYCFAVPISN